MYAESSHLPTQIIAKKQNSKNMATIMTVEGFWCFDRIRVVVGIVNLNPSKSFEKMVFQMVGGLP